MYYFAAEAIIVNILCVIYTTYVAFVEIQSSFLIKLFLDTEELVLLWGRIPINTPDSL